MFKKISCIAPIAGISNIRVCTILLDRLVMLPYWVLIFRPDIKQKAILASSTVVNDSKELFGIAVCIRKVMSSLSDLIDGKVVSIEQNYLVVAKDGKQFKIEFDIGKVLEMKKM